MIEVRIVSISKYCMVGEITKEAGQLVRMAELVQRKISLNALLAVSALVSSLLLIYRLRKSQSLN